MILFTGCNVDSWIGYKAGFCYPYVGSQYLSIYCKTQRSSKQIGGFGYWQNYDNITRQFITGFYFSFKFKSKIFKTRKNKVNHKVIML